MKELEILRYEINYLISFELLVEKKNESLLSEFLEVILVSYFLNTNLDGLAGEAEITLCIIETLLLSRNPECPFLKRNIPTLLSLLEKLATPVANKK